MRLYPRVNSRNCVHKLEVDTVCVPLSQTIAVAPGNTSSLTSSLTQAIANTVCPVYVPLTQAMDTVCVPLTEASTAAPGNPSHIYLCVDSMGLALLPGPAPFDRPAVGTDSNPGHCEEIDSRNRTEDCRWQRLGRSIFGDESNTLCRL